MSLLKSKKCLGVVLSVLLVAALVVGCGPTPTEPTPTEPTPTEPTPTEKFDVIWGCAREGGASYMQGAIMVGYTDANSDTISITLSPWGGTLHAFRALDRGDVSLGALIISDYFYANDQGLPPFDETPLENREDMVLVLGPATNLNFAFFARADLADEIKSWSDIAGHNVWLHITGSGAYEAGKTFLKALGIYDTVNHRDMDPKLISDAVKAGDIDVIFTFGSNLAMQPAFLEIDMRTPMVVVPPTDEELETCLAASPALTRGVFVFPTEQLVHGVGAEQVEAPTFVGSYYTRRGMLPEEVAYELVRMIYDGVGAVMDAGLGDVEGALLPTFPEQLFIDQCKSLSELCAPLHPGTARYFKEVRGIDLQANGVRIATAE